MWVDRRRYINIYALCSRRINKNSKTATGYYNLLDKLVCKHF